MPKEGYDEINELASSIGLSVSELIKKAVKDLERLRNEVYFIAWNQGFEDAILIMLSIFEIEVQQM